MDCYVYKGADVIGYFEDSKGRTQVLTTEGIYEDYEVGKNKKWIRENLKQTSIFFCLDMTMKKRNAVSMNY